mmetsp:Transcript_115313/g.366628  ORF Transcript_115313/g.366628 Transcript_115313/m.366628 type:complete len:273 (+) Transcript_115313:1197-2015(+)
MPSALRRPRGCARPSTGPARRRARRQLPRRPRPPRRSRRRRSPSRGPRAAPRAQGSCGAALLPRGPWAAPARDRRNRSLPSPAPRARGAASRANPGAAARLRSGRRGRHPSLPRSAHEGAAQCSGRRSHGHPLWEPRAAQGHTMVPSHCRCAASWECTRGPSWARAPGTALAEVCRAILADDCRQHSSQDAGVVQAARQTHSNQTQHAEVPLPCTWQSRTARRSRRNATGSSKLGAAPLMRRPPRPALLRRKAQPCSRACSWRRRRGGNPNL